MQVLGQQVFRYKKKLIKKLISIPKRRCLIITMQKPYYFVNASCLKLLQWLAMLEYVSIFVLFSFCSIFQLNNQLV